VSSVSTHDDLEFDEAKIDSIFRDLDQCHFPGAAVGIAICGDPVYRKGFGLASMELPLVLSPTIRMRVFSVTKQFTALAYMLLCEDGKAAIDDSIRTHLPELHPVTDKVTMRQLMGNISGLRDVHELSWVFSGTGRATTREELFSLYRLIDDVNDAPCSSFNYNNGGFLLLSMAIERISGQSLKEFFRERIFQPLGMNDSMLRPLDSDFVANSATLHNTDASGKFEKSYLGGSHSGEGGIVSTVEDMLRWMAHMDTPVVGNSNTWETMKSPHQLSNGTLTGYGLGLMSDRYRGAHTIGHSGGGLGGSAQIVKVARFNLDVVVLVNRQDVFAATLADKVLDACLPKSNKFDGTPKRISKTGVFCSRSSSRLIQLFAKAGEQYASIDGQDIPMCADCDGVLWPSGNYRFIKQAIAVSGDSRTPEEIRLSDFGNIDELRVVQPPKSHMLAGLAGRYRSHATGIEVTIADSDAGARLTTFGHFGIALFELECLAEGIWRAKSTRAFWLGGILTFERERGSFHFSNWRTKRLTFRRLEP
jgi:D-aminopeptidase